MARIVSSSYSPIIGINIVTTLDNGEKSVKEYHIDDMVENLRYVDGETVKTISGRLSNINYKGAMTSHKYSDLLLFALILQMISSAPALKSILPPISIAK